MSSLMLLPLVTMRVPAYQRRSLKDESSPQDADRDTIARVAAGDEGAFAELYDRLSAPLYSVALRMLGDAAEAQDALQDVCLQIWRRAASYDPALSSVFSWAMLLTRSRVIDRLRARGRRLRVVGGSLDDDAQSSQQSAEALTAANGSEIAEEHEEAARVRSALNLLPQEQREALDLAFFNDLTHEEIAARLGQPLGTIKARIRRGLLKLREKVHA